MLFKNQVSIAYHSEISKIQKILRKDKFINWSIQKRTKVFQFNDIHSFDNKYSNYKYV